MAEESVDELYDVIEDLLDYMGKESCMMPECGGGEDEHTTRDHAQWCPVPAARALVEGRPRQPYVRPHTLGAGDDTRELLLKALEYISEEDEAHDPSTELFILRHQIEVYLDPASAGFAPETEPTHGPGVRHRRSGVPAR